MHVDSDVTRCIVNCTKRSPKFALGYKNTTRTSLPIFLANEKKIVYQFIPFFLPSYIISFYSLFFLYKTKKKALRELS